MYSSIITYLTSSFQLCHHYHAMFIVLVHTVCNVWVIHASHHISNSKVMATHSLLRMDTTLMDTTLVDTIIMYDMHDNYLMIIITFRENNTVVQATWDLFSIVLLKVNKEIIDVFHVIGTINDNNQLQSLQIIISIQP